MANKGPTISNINQPGQRGTTYVSFICQRCYHPLRLDYSFLDREVLDELTVPCPSVEANSAQQYAHSSALDPERLSQFEKPEGADARNILSNRANSGDGNGFTLLGEASSGAKADNLSHRLKVANHLFDIMSGQTEIDHPLCEECTDGLLAQLDEQLEIAEEDLRGYRKLSQQIAAEDPSDMASIDEELQNLRNEEANLLKELEGIEVEKKSVKKRLEELDDEEKRLDQEEEKYWREYCLFQKSLQDFEDEQASVNNQLLYSQRQLDKLRKTNVFNSTFNIWHKGHFGTINGFRLGRLPSVPVEWTEINTAWGQTVLLLYSLAKKIGLTFRRYRLVPFGNHSYVECLDDKSKELPLYGSGGFRFFWDTKFDQAMVGFLDCLQQFYEEVESGDSGFYLPYRMEKGKIFDSKGVESYSIKIQLNTEEHWTKALKYMLTNLKWGLAWVSSQFAEHS